MVDNNDIVLVQYEYQPMDNDELYLRPGEYIKVVERGNDGWWKGEHNGAVGRFPRSFVDVVENVGHVSDEAPVKRNPTNDVVKKQTLEQGVVKLGYYPKQKNEMRLNVGEFVIVLAKCNGDMWMGQRYSRSGWFPKVCVEVTKTEELQDQGDNPENRDIQYEHAVAKIQYEPTRNDELSLNPGDVLLILEKTEDWWKGRIKENRGLFPKSSIEMIGNAKDVQHNTQHTKDNTKIFIGKTKTEKDDLKKVTIKSQIAQYKEEFLQCTSASGSSSSEFQVEDFRRDNLIFTKKAIWARKLDSKVSAPVQYAAASVAHNLSSSPPPSHWGFIVYGEDKSEDNRPVYLAAQLAKSPNDASTVVACHVCISIEEAARFFCNNFENKNVWVEMPRRNNIVTVKDAGGNVLPKLDDNSWEDLQRPMSDYELRLTFCKTDSFNNPYNLWSSNCQNFAKELWEKI